MKKKFLLSCLPVFFYMVSCSNAAEKEEVATTAQANRLFETLVGKWIAAQTDSSVYTEIWTRVNDSLYTSLGFMLKGKDTLFSEKVEIKAGSSVREYVPTVNNQNEGSPVAFRIISLHDSSFTAENTAHDFPQRIVYNLKKDSLVAYIEGKIKNGDMHREYFRMVRN